MTMFFAEVSASLYGSPSLPLHWIFLCKTPQPIPGERISAASLSSRLTAAVIGLVFGLVAGAVFRLVIGLIVSLVVGLIGLICFVAFVISHDFLPVGQMSLPSSQ